MRVTELQRHHINRQLGLIANKRFDQDTVKLLLVDIRELARRGSIIRGIGDFLAHPMRDKGISLPRVQAGYRELVRRTTQTERGSPDADLDACALFDEKDFRQEFSQVLESHGFLDDMYLAASLRREMTGVMLCVICLLAGGRLTVAGAEEAPELVLTTMSDRPTLGLSVTVTVEHKKRRFDVHWPVVTSSCLLDPRAARKLSPAGDERFAVVRRNPRGKLVMMTLDKDVDWAC